MKYNAKEKWTKAYSEMSLAYPSEYVIRIFKGSYPRLNLDKKSFNNKKICDVGCGDGRNLILLKECGFDLYGMEVTEEIVEKVKSNLSGFNIPIDIRVGTNDAIPFGDEYFDYLLSWNSCYYMGEQTEFAEHVREFARVVKSGGTLVLSVPKKTCFIFQGSKKLKEGYQIITNDPFNVRNGEVLRMFENEEEIEREFSVYFKDFVFASIHDDCFGYDYHWHVALCRRN